MTKQGESVVTHGSRFRESSEEGAWGYYGRGTNKAGQSRRGGAKLVRLANENDSGKTEDLSSAHSCGGQFRLGVATSTHEATQALQFKGSSHVAEGTGFLRIDLAGFFGQPTDHNDGWVGLHSSGHRHQTSEFMAHGGAENQIGIINAFGTIGVARENIETTEHGNQLLFQRGIKAEK